MTNGMLHDGKRRLVEGRLSVFSDLRRKNCWYEVMSTNSLQVWGEASMMRCIGEKKIRKI